MSNSILGIPLPGSPQGDPDRLRLAATGWRHAADELSSAVTDAQLGLDQLDWEGAGATAFHAAVAALAGHGRDASQHFGDFATGLQHAADTIDTAQTAYKASLGVAATAIAVGGALTIFTLGASDAAAAAIVAGSAAEMGGVVATLDLTMIGIDASIEITVQALLRVLFSVIGQFATNLISQETSYALTHGGLTGNLQYGEAAVFAAGALLPGAGGVGGYFVAAGTGAGLSAAGQLLDTGSINLDTLLISAGAAGLFHGGAQVFGSIRGGGSAPGDVAPPEATGGAPGAHAVDPATPAGPVSGTWEELIAALRQAEALNLPPEYIPINWGSTTDTVHGLMGVLPMTRYFGWAAQIEKLKAENPALAQIPRDDLIALSDVTTIGFDDVNTALWHGLETPRLQVYVDHAVAGMEHMPTFEGTVYREFDGIPPSVLDRLIPGQVVTEQGFTVSDMVQANQASTRFVIHSSTGRDLRAVSFHPPGQESMVLFKPGTAFKVVSQTRRGGVSTIVLKEMPRGTRGSGPPSPTLLHHDDPGPRNAATTTRGTSPASRRAR